MPENISPNAADTLISLIENDALIDIKNIDISAAEEDQIDLKCVQTWYIETEKLIRILANIIPATTAQSINQLRYAGHHILKAKCQTDKADDKANLIEAYKHCKRAYYDGLDLYVYHMSDIFRSKLSLLSVADNDLNKKISKHLQMFTQVRFECDNRIDYYQHIFNQLADGLRLIADINQKLKKQGITDKLLLEKNRLLEQINRLEQENDDLEKNNTALERKIDKQLHEADKRFYRRLEIYTLILMAVTAISIVFQGYFTEKWVTSSHQVQNEISFKQAHPPK